MKKYLVSLLIAPLLAGCAGLGRPLLDAGAAGGGAALAYTLSDGNLGITAAGAAGGALLAEGGQALVSSGRKKSFNSGYQKGQSDAVKLWYHQLQDRQRLPANP